MNPVVSDVVDLDSPDDIALADRMNAGRGQILTELRKIIIGQEEVIEQVLMTQFVGGTASQRVDDDDAFDHVGEHRRPGPLPQSDRDRRRAGRPARGRSLHPLQAGWAAEQWHLETTAEYDGAHRPGSLRKTNRGGFHRSHHAHAV